MDEAAARQRAERSVIRYPPATEAEFALARDLLAVLDEKAALNEQLNEVEAEQVYDLTQLLELRDENTRLRAALTDLLDRQALIGDYEESEYEGFLSDAARVEYERLCDEQAVAISAARALVGGG